MEESSHDDQDVDRLEDVTDELLDDEQEEIIVKSKRLSLPRRIVEKVTSEFSSYMLVPCMYMHGMIRGQLCICAIICHNMAMTLLFFIDSAFPILTTNSKKTTLSRRRSFTIIFCLYLSHMFSAWVSFPLLLLLSVLGGVTPNRAA